MSEKIETGGPAFPCDESVSRAFAVFEHAKKPLTDAEYTALVDRLKHGMTMRQYAAISMKVPSSGDEWLDDMIREARLMDAAEKAMQGFAADPEVTSGAEKIAELAYTWADAMLAARQQKGGAA